MYGVPGWAGRVLEDQLLGCLKARCWRPCGLVAKRRSGRFDVLNKYVFFKPARSPGTSQIRPEMGAPGPPYIVERTSKSLVFEVGVGDQLGTLRVSKSTR